MKSASETALALDDESAEAHVSAAISLLWRSDFPAAERAFLRAIELNPGNSTAHSWYSLMLRAMGRSQLSLSESRTAAELDPFGIVPMHNYGAQCYHVRDYNCAIEQLRRTLEIGPYPNAYRWLALTYVQLGKWQEAIAHAKKAVELAPERPDFVASLAYVYARAGQTDAARAALQRAKARPFEGFDIARAHVGLGEVDSVFVWFERSNWHWGHRASRDDPALDPVRSDPRFDRLFQKVDRELGLK